VTGIVRAHRQLVYHESAVRRLEEFDGHRRRPRRVRSPRCSAKCLGMSSSHGSSASSGAGAITTAHWPLPLHRLDHRPRGSLPERRPRDHRRQFPTHRRPAPRRAAEHPCADARVRQHALLPRR
jgi:hypothetical protein